jgi:hypothetical protein
MNATASMPSLADLQVRYIAVLPIVERYAPLACRGLKCPHRRDDAAQELRSMVWSWLVRLAQKGRDGTAFIRSLAYLAARAVRSHRKIAGGERAKDVHSPLAQARHGFRVEALPISTRRCHEDIHGAVGGQRRLDAYEERLQDNTVTPPDRQCMFRLDYRAWRAQHSQRDKHILDDLAQDETTLDVARKYRLSPSRISQMRRIYLSSWRVFCGDDEPAVPERQRAVGVA